MPISSVSITGDQFLELLTRGEGHFLDFKSLDILPAKLTKHLSAFANADGGEIYIGIDDGHNVDASRWRGFSVIEDANAHLQVLEEFFPLGGHFRYEFVRSEDKKGLLLHCEIQKTPDIRPASNGRVYLRRGAQSLLQDTEEKITRLRYNKGLSSYEDQIVNVEVTEVENSVAILEFMLENIPTAEPKVWLKKQRLIVDDRPTVAAIVLYSDSPQSVLPKSGVKIYRYKTSGSSSRETLADNPLTIEGEAYGLIFDSVQKIIETIESISFMGDAGLEKIKYPRESIHEIVTNAVLHRDYSINDDIHIRIFDNRIEVQSPGTLPGHVTVANILDERFARNPRMVRLINKYKNPPNKDVGEGLNTAFEAMRLLKLRDPIIEQLDGSVRITLKHEKLASPEEAICSYLRDHEEINNSKARSITFIGSENAVKRVFQKMIEKGVIERIEGRPLSKTAYRKGANFPNAPG